MYKKVNRIILPREYSIRDKNIEFIRRSFNFPDIHERECHVRLVVNRNSLLKIQNIENYRNCNCVRLESKLISMLNSCKTEKRMFLPRFKYSIVFIKMLLPIENRNFYTDDFSNISSIIRTLLVHIMSGKKIQEGRVS